MKRQTGGHSVFSSDKDVPISPSERTKMLRAHSIGPKMVDLVERAGISSLAELRGQNAENVALQIHVEADYKLNIMGVRALENLIALAELQNEALPDAE